MKAVYEPKNKEALQSQGITPTTFHELTPQGAQRFHDAISSAKTGPFAAAVTVKDVADYKTERLFLAEDSKSGFALAGDDLVSLFKHPDSTAKRIADSSLALGVAQGGRRLDCYDTALPRLYADNNFKTVARLPWNDEYKPPDWNYKVFDRYNKGKPDVVFMVHDPAAKPYRKGEGKTVKDYDAGIAEQQKWLGNKKFDDMLGRFFVRKYSEDQPRVPAGSPEGGRFGSGASGASAARYPQPRIEEAGGNITDIKAAQKQVKTAVDNMPPQHAKLIKNYRIYVTDDTRDISEEGDAVGLTEAGMKRITIAANTWIGNDRVALKDVEQTTMHELGHALQFSTKGGSDAVLGLKKEYMRPGAGYEDPSKGPEFIFNWKKTDVPATATEKVNSTYFTSDPGEFHAELYALNWSTGKEGKYFGGMSRDRARAVFKSAARDVREQRYG